MEAHPVLSDVAVRFGLDQLSEMSDAIPPNLCAIDASSAFQLCRFRYVPSKMKIVFLRG